MIKFLKNKHYRISILIILLIIVSVIIIFSLPPNIEKKKSNCETLEYDVKRKIDVYNSNVEPEPACGLFRWWEGPWPTVCAPSLEYRKFKEIFYSPKLDTCLYLETTTEYFKGDEPNKDYTALNDINQPIFYDEKFYLTDEWYSIKDVLTDTKIDKWQTKYRNSAATLLEDSFSSPIDQYPYTVEDMLKKYR